MKNPFMLLAVSIIVNTYAASVGIIPQKDLTISSNIITIDKNLAIYNGDVVLTKEALVIHANKATSNNYHGKTNAVYNLIGNPVTFKQLVNNNEIKGSSNQLSFDNKNSLIILTGNAQIFQQDKNVVGKSIIYNTLTHTYKVTNN
jgi:lipopolysaccharide transport protein LptA